VPRLVAVLGYSSRRGDGADAVLFSGWSRRSGGSSEAALMLAAWRGADVPLLDDGDARTTLGNARAVAAAAQALGATEVVLVTSSWHRLRARRLVQAALGPDVRLELVSPARPRPLHLVGRELVCLLALPLQLRSLR
jgi:uncharacterized SAM-binding protein YcdF (DUF218 family)